MANDLLDPTRSNDVTYDSLTTAITDRRGMAALRATTSLEDNPDNAAESMRLSDATGVPSTVIHADFDGFKERYKAKLTSDIVRNNPIIAEYIQSHPLAASLSNDDYASLDGITNKSSAFGSFARGAELSIIPTLGSLPAMGAGAEAGAALGAVGGPIGALVGGVVGGLAAGLVAGHFIGKAQDYGISKLDDEVQKTLGIDPEQREADAKLHPYASMAGSLVPMAGVGGFTGPLAQRIFGGILGGGLEAGTQIYQGDDLDPTKIAMQTAFGAAVPGLSKTGEKLNNSIVKHFREKAVEVNDQGVKQLDELVSEAQSNLTRERSSESFQQLLSKSLDNSTMEISGRRVLELYGDKPPSPDDNLLGWAPNIAEQLNVARETGADITIPMADWITRIDPALHRELKDDLKVVRGGMTKNEAKDQDLLEPVQPINEALPIVKEALAAEPMFAIGDRKLQLQRMDGSTNKLEGFGSFHDFDMLNERGESVGTINLSEQNEGKHLYIEMINGKGEYYRPNNFGPSLIRDIARQLTEQFPNAEWLTGHRVTGARDAVGSVSGPAAMPKIRLRDEAGNPLFRDMDYSPLYHDQVSELFGGAWQNIHESGLEGYIKPAELWQGHEHDIAEAAISELKRIVPTARVSIFSELRKKDTNYSTSGSYIPYRDIDPLIALTLNSSDTIGTARHEAIHFLYRQGFFNAKEWSALEKAAKEEGWVKRFNIDKRYADQPEIHLEEAIAEGYRHWVDEAEARHQAKLQETPIDKIFAKLQELLEGIKSKLREVLGREPTFDELFKKVDSGEVGRRGLGDEQGRLEPAFAKGEPPIEGGPEKISSAAIRINGKLYTGNGHFEAIENASKRLGKSVDDLTNQVQDKDLDGFITTKGRYITREEAHDIAKNQNQYANDVSGKPMSPVDRQAYREMLDDKTLTDVGEGGVINELKPKNNKNEIDGGPGTDVVPPFVKGNAVGMTAEQYKLYMKNVTEQQDANRKATAERVLKEQTKRQTKEWKDLSEKMRPEVIKDLNARPDIAADKFFGLGELFGEKLDKTYKLDWNSLTPEQRATLPESYTVRKGGVNPDEIASIFGYQTGDQMIQSVAAFDKMRKDSGKNRDSYQRELINAETQRRMEAQYGFLEKNIIEESVDQVLSENQINMLHQETTHLAMLSGEKGFDLTREQLGEQMMKNFDQLKMGFVKSDKYLNEAGKLGKMAEMAALKGDWKSAFQAKQPQYFNMAYAQMAKALERQQEQLDKLAKKYSKESVKGVDPEFVPYIQKLLGEAGYKIPLTGAELQKAMDFHGSSRLNEFVEDVSSRGYDPIVSDELQYNGAKPLGDMSVVEFKEFKEAIETLNHSGREINKVIVAGEKQDFKDVKQKIVDNITQLPARSRDSQGNWFYKIDASLTKMEEMVKDLDLRKELGPLWDAVIHPMVLSKTKEFDLLTDLSKYFKEVRGGFSKEWRKSLDKTIPQDIIHDPYTGVAYDMKKENLVQIMLNWGTRSNIDKFVNGAAFAKYGKRLGKDEAAMYERMVKSLIDQHATKEDWDFVHAMWQPFKGWRGEMDNVARNTSGVAPKWVDSLPIETPHGTYEGGYWPVKYDKLGSGIDVIKDRQGQGTEKIFSNDYFRAATSKGYLAKRTGYVDFVDINRSIEQAAATMQQTIHDIAFRDSLMQASKFFYDKDIRAAIGKHYGKEYEAQLIPWLKRISYQFSADDPAIQGWNDFLRRTRTNLISHVLPFNFNVIFSPAVGTINPLKAVKILNPLEWADMRANAKEYRELAMTHSHEIRHLIHNLDRDYREALDRVTTKFGASDYRQKVLDWGYKPTAFIEERFRIATFVKEFKDAKARGLSDNEAGLIGDSKVREQHGAASIVDLPAAMSSNESFKMLTIFGGYFNTMYNWQRQLPGQLRRHEWSEAALTAYGSILVGTAFNAALFNQSKEGDSWFKIMGKALISQPLSTVPVLNQVTSYALEGFSPRMPIAALLTSGNSLYSDMKKFWKGEKVEKPITHVANVVGLTTGTPLAQIGRSAQFLTDVARDKQRPKNILEWWRGLKTGKAKLDK